jgi:hypothetical protein
MCGFQTGEAYKILSGFMLTNITAPLEESQLLRNEANLPLFFDGLIDGLDCEHFKAMKAEVLTIVADVKIVMAGDLVAGLKLAEDYAVIKEQLLAVVLPKLSMTDVVSIYMANMKEINTHMDTLQVCEGYECGVATGKILAIITN